MNFSKLHPLLVHFPAGLLVTGALFEIYGKLFKDSVVSTAGNFNVRFGFWCALPTMGVGFLGVMGLDVTPKFRAFLSYHILCAFLTATLFGCVLLLSRFREKRWAVIIRIFFLVLGLLSVIATGYFGGELVHRFGVATLQPVN